MSRTVLALLIIAVGLGVYLWLVELPREQKRLQSETAAKRLLDFKESEVQNFTLRSADGEIEISRGDQTNQTRWTITKPKKLEADTPAVEEFLRALELAKVNRVVDDSGADLSSYGLAVPSLTVSLRLGAGAKRVEFGDSGPLSSSLYAKRDADSKIVLTSLSGREILAKTVQDFRRKRVVEFDRDRVTRIKVATPRETVVLYKEGPLGKDKKPDWKIKAPIETPADQPEVQSLLFGLEDLKAQRFVEDSRERQERKAQLSGPVVTITLHEEDADRTVTLYTDSKNAATVYAETVPQEPLYVVAGAPAKDLAKGLFTLRNKQLITAEPDQVKTLVVKKEADEYSLTHEGNDWLIDGDPAAKADAGRINMLVSRAVRLQAERIVTDKPAELKRYGLAPPVAELTAADAQGKVLGRIAFGKQQEGLVYALGSAMPGIFQVRPDLLQEIPKKSELAKADKK
jgi:hypothetical protein